MIRHGPADPAITLFGVGSARAALGGYMRKVMEGERTFLWPCSGRSNAHLPRHGVDETKEQRWTAMRSR